MIFLGCYTISFEGRVPQNAPNKTLVLGCKVRFLDTRQPHSVDISCAKFSR
jgi:hypothetical protein